MFFLLLACAPDVVLKAEDPVLSVTPALADAGDVAVGSDTVLTVSLSCIAGSAVSVLAADLTDTDQMYHGPDEPLPTVALNTTSTLTFHYRPTAAGYHAAVLTITTDEPATRTLVLRGHAAESNARMLPALLDFGPVAPGSRSSGAVLVENTGTLDLVVSGVQFDNDRFTLDSALPIAVPAGSSSAVSLVFSPDDLTEQRGTASLDLGAGGALDVSLRGNACSSGAAELYDQDDDGTSGCSLDCDDTDPAVHPGAAESCDAADQDCDGQIDEGTECGDDDGDGYSEQDGDCNDGDPDASPGLIELLGNGWDDDCDGVADLGTDDGDTDGYGPLIDCDDSLAAVYPGATEVFDGLDNDCDGFTDESTTTYDDDGDGLTEVAGDCDDADPTTFERAPELADGRDNDCDGTVDEGTTDSDDDGDGFTETGGDCDDTRDNVHPAAGETLGDGLDNNCDGVAT